MIGSKKILIIAPDVYKIPPEGYGGIERIVTLVYLFYIANKYKIDIISKKGSKFHSFSMDKIKTINLKNYYFIICFYYAEDVVKFLDQTHLRVYLILQNNFSQKLKYLKTLKNIKLFVLSKDQQKQYKENLKINTEYNIIPNGVDSKFFTINNKTRKKDIVFIGAIGQHKSPLSCLKYARKHNLGIDFYGPLLFRDDENDYKNKFLVELTNYPKAKILKETTDDKFKVGLLNQYKYFIFLPGTDKKEWTEPFGIAPLEAMFCGCTVITQFENGGHLSFCNSSNSISYNNPPKQLDPIFIRNSVTDYDFEKIFKTYYPK